MDVSIVTVFPEIYHNFLQTSLIKRAQEQKLLSFDVRAFSSFCEPKERIDSPTVGHGAGMAIRPEVMERAVTVQEKKYGKAYRIFLTPQGKKLDQTLAKQLSQMLQKQNHIMFVAGRYEGIDERAVQEYADLELSIGDYVLMGGDLPVMVAIEAITRYLPGVVGKGESVEKDSFSGPFVDFPTYTTPPREWKEQSIPDVLLSGNHKAMNDWRVEKAAERSVLEHFDWVRAHCKDKKDQEIAAKYIPNHYCALMHDDVIVEKDRIGTSSVTSLDIHDIARSARTYGIKNYFIVTPLEDQQRIVNTILGYWNGCAGIAYNKSRSDAVSHVKLVSDLDTVKAAIKKQEGVEPLVIATSAQAIEGVPFITYHDQHLVWREKRPVLLIFGTAKGLSSELVKQCDYLLGPVLGFSNFNHLSVRSAAAIIFDRWLGINFAGQ
jgi:tRNA (guanine37-N1)-methyltransferase